MRKFLLLLLAMAVVGAAAGSDQCQVSYGVPFASDLESPVKNYNRASDRIATAGELTPAEIGLLWGLGFDAVVDVRPAAPEIIAREREVAETHGLSYYHLPYTDEGVSDADLATFTALVADPRQLRILVHCQRGSRAGAFLASYYLRVGANREFALTAGRAAGLAPEMEAELVARLDRG
jgi:uncharacterized protein (TIGR01244 family)